MLTGAFVVVRRRMMVMRRLMRAGVVIVPADRQLALHAKAAHLAKHGRRHRTPDREQDGHQQQEADSNGFHGQSEGGGRRLVSRHFWPQSTS